MAYDKFIKIELADTGKVNLSDTSTTLTAIDYITLNCTGLQEEGNVYINSVDSMRQDNFTFDYQTNTRNGIKVPRMTVRGICDDTEIDIITTLKTMKKRNTIKKIKGGINMISADPDLVIETNDSFLYVQISNLTFTENTSNPNTTNFTLQLERVNQ